MIRESGRSGERCSQAELLAKDPGNHENGGYSALEEYGRMKRVDDEWNETTGKMNMLDIQPG